MGPRRSITELKGRYQGQDVWVIGSGPTLDYVRPDFFANKLAVGVNDVWKRFPCTFLVRKEHAGSEEALQAGIPLILSEYDCGHSSLGRNRVSGPAWYFPHRDNACVSVDLSVIGTDTIVVSYSTITSALHLAAYMGAQAILLCGHDCGTLDGKSNFDGYYTSPPGSVGGMKFSDWLRFIEHQSIEVRERLREVYGCHVHSLNPFINPGLEGHRFRE